MKWGKEWVEIRKKHRDNALSSRWLCDHGYAQLVSWTTRHFGSWEKFIKCCGFQSLRNNINRNRTKESARKEFLEIIKKHGDRVLNTQWLTDNKYGRLHGWAYRNFGSWPKFLDFCLRSYTMSEKEMRTTA